MRIDVVQVKLYRLNPILSVTSVSKTTTPAPYLAVFEQGGSADIFSLITGGGGGWGAEMTLLRAL